MATAVRVKTIVLPGGKIEVSAPELIPGQHATVFVVVEEDEPPEKRHALDILAELPGHLEFRTAEDVDRYIQEERASWED
jgi:hypothetical protein